MGLLLLMGGETGRRFYVDATGGDDLNDGLSPENAWQTISKVNGSTFQPGDTILFKRGETWNDELSVPSSGTSTRYIRFDAYGSGDKPLIDCEGLSARHCVLLNNKSYVEVKNFRMIGSGQKACFRVQGTSGAGGYFVRATDCDVIRNYAVAPVPDGDGFSLDNTAELLMTNCTADKCRPNPAATGSHQCITTHNTSKVYVNGGTFSDSHYAFAGVQASSAVFNNVTVSGITISNFEINAPGATCTINNSTITTNAGARIGSCASGSNLTTLMTFNDCTITTANTSININIGGILTFSRCNITISDLDHRFSSFSGQCIIEDSTITFTVNPDYSFLSEGGLLVIRRNTISGMTSKRYVTLTASSGGAQIYQNIFSGNSNSWGIWMFPSCQKGAKVWNNIFLGMGKIIYNQGTNATEGAEVKNNIFSSCSDAIDGTTGLTAENNLYWNTTSEGETGAVSGDPLWVNAGAGNYRLSAGSPAIGAGVDVGLTTDRDGTSIPQGAAFDIGPYEYVS